MTRRTTITVTLLAALAATLTFAGIEETGSRHIWLAGGILLFVSAGAVAIAARFRDRAPVTPGNDVFGPVYPDERAARRALRHLAVRHPTRARRLSRLQALRAALTDALTSRRWTHASSRMNEAEELWRQLSVDPELTSRDRETLQAVIDDCRRVFPTCATLNCARAIVARRGGNREAALEAVSRGLRNGGDRSLLERARAAIDHAEALPPSPTVSFSTGTVGARVWGLGTVDGARRPRVDSSIAEPRSRELAALVAAGDLDGLMRIEPELRHAADRHRALLAIVEESYRRRHRADMRAICERYAWEHVDRFEQFLPALRAASEDPLTVPSFQRLAALLMEDGDLEGAEHVCLRAVNLGLKDAAGQGFEGRLSRIRRQTDGS